MIDFRYHLVSLVSVFLALAVGVALGAGPLREPISGALTDQLQQLSADRSQLRKDLGTAEGAVANRDVFLTDVAPALVADQLGGRTVVLVTLPGIEGEAVAPLTRTLQTAGARVVGRIDVQESWTDPGRQGARQQVVDRLASAVPSGTPRTPQGQGNAQVSADAAPLAALLARAVVTGELAQSGESDATGRRILEELSGAGLVDVDGDFAGRATEAVLLVPGVPQPAAGATPTPTPSPDPAPVWTVLGTALDAGSDGAVAVGPASSALAGGVIAAVRATQAAAVAVSTVDTGGTPMGDVTTVLALREQQLGGAGNYGFGAGAAAPLPPRTLPDPRTSPS